MAGKQHKREAKRAKLAAREAARRRERQRTLQTAAVIGVLVLLGGVVIALSVRESRRQSTTDPLPTEIPTALPTATESAAEAAAEPCEPAAPPATALGEGEAKPTFPDGPDDVLEEGRDYRAVVETSCGRIVFDLFEQDAPETVNSFVFLARQGFFDGLRIFRNATSISALQTGAGDDTNTWDVGYTLPDEFGRARAQDGYEPGDLAMAKTAAPDSGGSQFFLVYGQTPLPPEYSLFGNAIEGLDVLRSIGAIPTTDPADPSVEEPSAAVYLESVTIETGEQAAAPEPQGS